MCNLQLKDCKVSSAVIFDEYPQKRYVGGKSCNELLMQQMRKTAGFAEVRCSNEDKRTKMAFYHQ